ncbi:hypothetical protein BDV93DRAFT_510656 [Ceratobasidium sp. AG-I]|nr:hypothetical protein BDV93DRAFT_510656 [Ceratobasidium sp. AG-I]
MSKSPHCPSTASLYDSNSSLPHSNVCQLVSLVDDLNSKKAKDKKKKNKDSSSKHKSSNLKSGKILNSSPSGSLASEPLDTSSSNVGQCSWVKGKGQMPPGFNQPIAGSSKHLVKIKVELGDLVVPKRKSATKKGIVKEEVREQQGLQKEVVETDGACGLTNKDWDLVGFVHGLFFCWMGVIKADQVPRRTFAPDKTPILWIKNEAWVELLVPHCGSNIGIHLTETNQWVTAFILDCMDWTHQPRALADLLNKLTLQDRLNVLGCVVFKTMSQVWSKVESGKDNGESARRRSGWHLV